MKENNEIIKLEEGFTECSKIFIAIGDETRQHLILEMMKMRNCNGLRIIEIAEKTNLSRAAVSHHLQIMKDAGIIKRRKEGTKSYYYFDPDMEIINKLISTLQLVKKISLKLPERDGEDK